MLTILPQSPIIANKTKTGVNISKIGYNKFLKCLKNKIFSFNFVLKLNKKIGPKPINIIRGYLIKLSNIIASEFVINCEVIDDLENNIPHDI